MPKPIICGKKSVLEALEYNVPISTIYCVDTHGLKIPKDIRVEKISRTELDRLTDFANHQGIAAELDDYNYYDIDNLIKEEPDIVLALDHIQDPHNLGAIIRSANAAGVKHIIIPKDRATEMTPTVWKVASGGTVGVKLIKVASLFDAVTKLKEIKKYWVYSSAVNEKAIKFKNASFNKKMVLIVGNEQSGVSSTLLKISDEVVYIPMAGTVQSLNVSVATGILLFDILSRES